MREFIQLLELPPWSRAVKTVVGASVLAASVGSAWAQQQTHFDLLVNHQAGMAYFGVEDNSSIVNGPTGAEFIYQARVKINGASGQLVNDVTLTQKLPIDTIFQGIDGLDGVVCTPLLTKGTRINASNRDIQCRIPSVTSDSFLDLNFHVILPSQSTEWKAEASAVAANNLDQDIGNNTGISRNITTYDAADLKVAFSGPTDNANVVQGAPFSYDLLVTNKEGEYGKDLAAGEQVIVRFEQPDGVIFSGYPTGTGWQCESIGDGGPIWECTYIVGAVVVKGSDLPKLSVPASAQSIGAISALASVSSADSAGLILRDVVPNDNSSKISVQVQADTFTNVTLAKTVQPAILDKLGGSQAVQYTITPRWASGTANPGQVTVTDPMPEGVTIDTAELIQNNSPAWNCSASTNLKLSCTFAADNGNYPSRGNNFPALQVPATVAASAITAAGTIDNTALVSATGEHPEHTGDNSATASLLISNQANLKLAKSGLAAGGANLGVIRNDTVFAYKIRITNDGPVDVLSGQSITVSDQLNSHLLFVAATDTNVAPTPTSTQWQCSTNSAGAGALVTCSFTNGVAVGKYVDLYLWVRATGLPENGTARLENTASVTAPAGRDPLPLGTGIGHAPGVNVSDKSADLAIQKNASTANGATAKSGDMVTYTLTVTNTGDATKNQAAKTVHVNDTIINLITSEYGKTPFSIAAIQEDTTALASRYWYNPYLTVKLSGTNNDLDTCSLNGYNNQTEANLSCTFNDMPVNGTYTITVQAKQFVDPYTGSEPHSPTGVVANGKNGVLSNTATVSSPDTNDSVLTNNSATVYVPMQALTDLTVKRQASPLNKDAQAQAAAGGAIVYTVTVENVGPSAASNVVMKDTLPLGAYWVGMPPVASRDGICGYRVKGSNELHRYKDGDEITADNQLMECTWDGNFAKGQQTVSYRLRSEQEVDEGAYLNSSAVVSTVTDEADYTNNDAEQRVLLTQPQVDVLVEMRHTADGIPLGEKTTYTITVTNNAASDSYARDVVMNNLFHSQINMLGRAPIDSSAVFEFGEITAINSRGRDEGAEAFTADNCLVDKTSGAGGLQCNFPWMAPGESVDISFTMTAHSLPEGKAVGSIFHNATVNAALETMERVDVKANNTTQDRTSTYDPAQLDPNQLGGVVLADLELTKAVVGTSHADAAAPQGDPVTAGSTVTYELQVRNLDTGTSAEAIVTDVLPAGVSLVEKSLTGQCDYAPATRTLTCEVPPLAAKAVHTIGFSVILDTPYYQAGEALTNCAALDSALDPVDDNNRSCASVPAKPSSAPTPVPSLGMGAIALLAFFMMGMPWVTRRRFS